MASSVRSRVVATVVIGAIVFIAAPLWANDFFFNNCGQAGQTSPPCPNNDPGPGPLTYTSATGLTVTAAGFSSPSTPTNLFIKDQGVGEQGLGINGTVDNEISTTSFVQLNTTSLQSKGFTSGTLSIDSLTDGEAYQTCASNTAGSLGSCSAPLTVASTLVPFSSTDPYIGVIASGDSSDVLIHDLDVTVVPEPASMLLFGTGVVGLTLIRRRFKR